METTIGRPIMKPTRISSSHSAAPVVYAQWGRVHRLERPVAKQRQGTNLLSGNRHHVWSGPYPLPQQPDSHLPRESRVPRAAEAATAPNTNIATSTTAPTNNYSINLPFQKTTTRYDVKIDYQITSKDHLSGRYNKDDIKIFRRRPLGLPAAGRAETPLQGTGTQNTYSTGINYDHAFSGTLLTEARIGVANYGNSATPTGYGTDYAKQIGIPGVHNQPVHQRPGGILMQDLPTARQLHLSAIPLRSPGYGLKPTSMVSTTGPRSFVTTPSIWRRSSASS